jgi:hypothetical protein
MKNPKGEFNHLPLLKKKKSEILGNLKCPEKLGVTSCTVLTLGTLQTPQEVAVFH